MNTDPFGRSRRSACRLGAAILLIFGFAGAGRAQDVIPDSVTGLPAEVQSVVSGGYWSNSDKEGFFRAVVVAGGIEHVGVKLYLQWLGVDLDRNTVEPLATVPVSEVNASTSGERTFDIKMDRNAEFGTFHLVVTVSQSKPQRQTRFDLTANGKLGTYAVAKAK